MYCSHLMITAEIPTIGRPELRSAVESTLAQGDLLGEVIIVADTERELDLPQGNMIRVIRVGPHAGGNVARMTGIRNAKFPLIALLDDDDTWLPTKLSRQVDAVVTWRHNHDCDLKNDSWLSGTQVVEPTGRVWPIRMPSDNERITHYLFRKTSLRAGQGALHTSTMLFPRSLAMRIPWDETLKFHQDVDWLARVEREEPRIQYLLVPSALSALTWQDGSVSRRKRSIESMNWALGNLCKGDPAVLGDFLLTVSYVCALREKNWRAALKIVSTAIRVGPPSFWGMTSAVTLPLKFFVGGVS